MTDGEKLKIAMDALEKLADEKHMAIVADGMSRFGSAGASIMCESVRKYARETLEKISSP